MLGAVTGSVDRPRRDRAGRELVAVRERVVRILRSRVAMDRDRDVVLERQPSVTGHVVGVRVRLQHAHDAHALLLGRRRGTARSRRRGRSAAPRPRRRRRRGRRRTRGPRRRTAGTASRADASSGPRCLSHSDLAGPRNRPFGPCRVRAPQPRWAWERELVRRSGSRRAAAAAAAAVLRRSARPTQGRGRHSVPVPHPVLASSPAGRDAGRSPSAAPRSCPRRSRGSSGRGRAARSGTRP